MNKRILSFVLSFAMIFGVFSSVSAAPSPEKLEDADKQVRVIVELEKDPIIKEAAKRNLAVDELSANSYSSLNKSIMSQQDSVKNDIERSNVDLNYHSTFTNVINGFSATASLSEIERIENTKGVKRVSIATAYDRPVPHTSTSKDIVQAVETWDIDYKGEGLVVSIIDTGLDFSHKDMVLTNPEKGKIKSKDINSKIVPGKYFTAKVPYGYNYMDNNTTVVDVLPTASSHGTHVGGIVGANGEVKGVAPEVQLLAMKVFSNDAQKQASYSDIVIKAIDDSVKLGADVINLSLGAPSAFTESDGPQEIAITNAVEAGIVCSVTAGNSNHILDGYGLIHPDNPDYGVLGSPGLAGDSLQVGAIENSHVKSEALKFDGEFIGYMVSGKNGPVEIFKGQEVEFTDGGDGSPEFLEDVKGKIALVVRGGNTGPFNEKIQNAIDAGAAGIIVRNHEAGGENLQGMLYPEGGKIPALFIGYTDGLKLLEGLEEGKNTVEFTGEKALIRNPQAGKMLFYTSWGPTPSLGFKPEISAPGGSIYSTLQGDKYGIKGGTSQAAPHVSGGAALVMERVNKEFNLKGREKAEMIKNLLMSTATPAEENGALTSPRRQGAGVMNIFAAATTDVLLTEAGTNISKVELKEVGDNIEFTLKLKNFGSKSLSYTPHTSVQTDAAFDDMNFNEPQDILDAPVVYKDLAGEVLETIDVATGEEKEFKVTIDLSEATDSFNGMPLDEVFKNGAFVEGFISLKETTDTEPALNIPYMGFYGQWDKAPVIDNSVYETDKASYYQKTGLTWLDGKVYKYLGSPFAAGDPLIENAAFSPNGDGLNDIARPALTFLRNAKEVQVNILDKDGALVRILSRDKNIKKSYFGNGTGKEFVSQDSWAWDGKVYGKVKEGDYKFQIKTKIDFEGAAWQTKEYPIKIDLTKPSIESVKFDKASNKIDISAKDNLTPIFKYEVISKGEVILETDNASIDLSGLKELPYSVTVKAYDYALNFAESELINLADDPHVPVVHMQVKDKNTTSEVEVKGYVDSKSNLTVLKINDKDIDFKYDTESKTYKFETLMNLKDGVHTLKVYAKNSQGRDLEFERTVSVDTQKPELSVISAPTRLVSKNTETVKAKIKVKENSGNVRVVVYGNEVFKKDTSYTVEFTPVEEEIEIDIPIEAGDNDIKVIVEDGFGHKTEESIGKVYRKVF